MSKQAKILMQECRLTILAIRRREVGGEVGYYPSCSLPMRMGRVGAVKPDCFVALVILTETYSGMFFYPHSGYCAGQLLSLIGLWSCSLLRVLRR